MNNYAQYQFFFNVFQFVFTCLIGVVAWWRTREKVSADGIQSKIDAAVKKRDETCGKHGVKTEALEQKVASLALSVGTVPSQKQVERIHERLDTMLKMISTVEGEIKGMGHTLDLLQEHHLSGGK